MSTFEDPCGKTAASSVESLQGIFDCKEVYHLYVRSLTPQSRCSGTGNALAFAVQGVTFPEVV